MPEDKGPLYIFTVPDSFTRDDMEHLAKTACKLPSNVLGTAFVMPCVDEKVPQNDTWPPVVRKNETAPDLDAVSPLFLLFVTSAIAPSQIRDMAKKWTQPFLLLHPAVEVSQPYTYPHTDPDNG